MTPYTKYGILILALATAFATGRFLTPTKVVETTKIVEVQKKTVDTDRDKHKETVTVTKKGKDGSEETTTKTVEETVTKQKVKDDINKNTEVIKIVTRGRGPTVSLLAGFDYTSPGKPFYGASVIQPVFGPITLGVWGLTNSTVGLSIGLEF
jgi:hypothetical protein